MLKHKVAIVTGVSRGIGAGIARELAVNGGNIVMAARTVGKTLETPIYSKIANQPNNHSAAFKLNRLARTDKTVSFIS
jgi:NAD(P)-dependent dehydrogenase (short-subunit alcohol dehydrogenase family)